LAGCLAGYQAATSYGSAVYFALEAIWGIARDIEIQSESGQLDPSQIDPDWIISPLANRPVPWLWIRSLAQAWGQYKRDGGPLGRAFGLEGGQGKSPVDAKLAQMLDDRAIARWIFVRWQKGRLEGKPLRLEDLIQEAAEKFDKSDSTTRRAWQRFGRAEKKRFQE
jgi:hypothetical protein